MSCMNISRPRNVNIGQASSRKTAAPFVLTPSTMIYMPQITARLIPSTAIMKTAMATKAPRNMRAKCRSSANGPVAGKGA
jgi:hypothetical protein